MVDDKKANGSDGGARPSGSDGHDVVAEDETQGPRRLAATSTRQLMSDSLSELALLIRKELELARTEVREDMRREVASLVGLAVAGVFGYLTVAFLLVTGLLALARVVPAWGAALLASAIALALAVGLGVAGWRGLKRPPLQRTRRTIKEEAKWIGR